MSLPDLEFNPPWLSKAQLPDHTPPLRWRLTYLGVGIVIGFALGEALAIAIFAFFLAHPEIQVVPDWLRIA